MMVRSRWCPFLVISGGLALALAPSCRDERPEPVAYYRDLGEGGRVLPPTPAARLNFRLGEGSVEWIPFRKPSESSAEEVSGPEAALRDVQAMLQDVNGAMADEDWDAVGDFFQEPQRAALRKVIDLSAAGRERRQRLGDALKEKLPDAEERVDAALSAARKDFQRGFHVKDLVVAGEGQVTGRLADTPPMLAAINFVNVDGDWYIDWPILTTPGMTTMLESMVGVLDQLIQELSSGAMPAEQVLTQIEAQAKLAREMGDAGGGEAPGSEEPAGTPGDADGPDDGD
jgi:hypothetical protein